MQYFSALIVSRSLFEQNPVTDKTTYVFGRISTFAPMLLLLLIGLNVFARAQIVSSEATQLSANERAEALKLIKEKFRELYVIPEMRLMIIERLNKAQQSGRYETSDPQRFAERITEDLRDVAQDKHLSLSYDRAAYAAALAPSQSDAGEDAFRRRRAIRNNHGIAEMRILPGNIRYLKITRFEWVPDETGAIYDEAMRFLKDGDAWIVDLRGNGGGTSAAANYFLSHFHEPGTFGFTSYAGSELPQRNYALDYLPSGRLKGKALYILIDGSVGSAAEAVAYDLQQSKIAVLVGTKTAGAANNAKLLPIAPGFILSISYGRPLHVVTNTNWEGVGVKPDLEGDSFAALDMAQSRALKRLAEQPPGAPPGNLTEYNWALEAVEARLRPVNLSAAQMTVWAGRFQSMDYGEVKVGFESGVLWLERSGRPRARLSPLTANGVFAIEGSELLRARLTGKTLELLWRDDPNPRIFVRK